MATPDAAAQPVRIPYAVAARELLRHTLLDAVRDALGQRSWADITMAEIALAAGVSRQTLYNEFGSRDALGQAFVMREGDRFLEAVEQSVLAHGDDPTAALTAAFDVFLTAVGEDPVVRSAIFDQGGEGLLPMVTTQGQPVVERAVERLAGIILATWQQVVPDEAELLAECMVRLALSFAALPKGPAGMTAASVSKLLGPYIEQVLGP